MSAIPDQSSFVIEIEQEVLASLLLNGGFQSVVSILEPHHFLEPLHSHIFAAIQQAHERFNSTRPDVVIKLVDEGVQEKYRLTVDGDTVLKYLNRLAVSAVQGIQGLEKSARRVVDQWAKAQIAKEASLLFEAANDPSSSPVDLIKSFGMASDDILSEVRRGPRRKSQISIMSAAQNAFEAAREAQRRGSGLTGMTWGLTDVNHNTGGIHKRDLTLIGARPSMGKTTVALSTALKVAKAGHGVGFISLEMDADKLAARAVTDLAYDMGIKAPYQDLITGRVTHQDLGALESVARQIENLPLLIEEQSGLSMTDIRIKLESMMQKMEEAGTSLELLMIDHLGLIRASNRYSGNRNNEIAEMTAGLKSMAREYGIAVVLLSQLNRALETQADKRPQLSSLRDSGAIEQDADTIIFLYREAYYLQREKGLSPEKEDERINRLADCQNKLEFSIAKQRNGPVTSIDLFIDVACSAVRNAARF
ncbi:replicative DNA helicase [Ochrobactrum sp. J50]|uniref:replicative DNA helicase n=1 Tax=Ochrobactrum sp. J50 TaxID=936132 RepID=UPI00119CA54F|nr:DnaB-like helicase C-terminal domain-containing protein [Ochrobactrum sp. J50]TWH01427.1 replicative DNA helicase [Ochrobactrum sp. J50]